MEIFAPLRLSTARSRGEVKIMSESAGHEPPQWPAWLLGGNLVAHYQRLRDKRADDFVSQAAELSGLSEVSLLRRIEDGDSFADLFQHAVRRVIESGDPVFHETPARLVAVALHDARRIREVSYMLTKLERFKPLHIRIITALPYNAIRSEPEMQHYTMSTTALAECVNVNELLIESAMSELTDSGFIAEGAHHGDHYEYYLDWLGVFFRHLLAESAR
jgi:hypothetical protein